MAMGLGLGRRMAGAGTVMELVQEPGSVTGWARQSEPGSAPEWACQSVPGLVTGLVPEWARQSEPERATMSVPGSALEWA